MFRFHQVADDLAYIGIKCRQVRADTGKREQHTVVFKCVVRATHDAVSVAAAISDQHHRNAVQAHVVANLLKCARIKKGAML